LAEFIEACESGNVRLAQRAADVLRLDRAEVKKLAALDHACAAGQLGAAQWLAHAFLLTGDDLRESRLSALESACREGHTQIAEWLMRAFALTPEDVRKEPLIFFFTCCRRHAETAAFLVATVGFGLRDILAYYPSEKLIQWASGLGSAKPGERTNS
jgi:hypothetical protein